MKIINVTPGILPIPPNGWGATEKIIWEYHQIFLKNGYDSKILYLDDVLYDNNTIVHIHVANLAILAHERGIPYYFTCHDHHAYLYGKNSQCFKDNYEAIKHSIKSFVPAKYLVKYFDLPNLEYLSHGINNNIFKSVSKKIDRHKLLCVANNGFLHDSSEDRKGFGFAIEAAKKLNLPITIAGPKNNKNFFDKHNFDYEKLNIIYDLNEQELISLYQDHSIFIHPSILEAGHPNLTMLEAIGCGLPVVGTFEDDNMLNGLIKINRNVEEIVNSVIKIIDNYDHYQRECNITKRERSWENIVNILINIYNKKPSMREQLLKIYETTIINHKESLTETNKLQINFLDGCKVEITGDVEKEYNIQFHDKKNNSLVYETNIKNNMWCMPSHKYYVDWIIKVKETNTNNSIDYELNLNEKNVKIINESPALGDFFAWVPFVDLFQKKHKCNLDFYTPHRELVESSYSNIKFHNYSDNNDKNYYATYKIGYFDPNDRNYTPTDPRTITLQQVATDILGLEYFENKPKLVLPKNLKNNFEKKYVCIGSLSTAQAKFWNNPTGWSQVVNYLKQLDYEVVSIDKHSSIGNDEYKNSIPIDSIDKTGNLPLEERINDLYHCDFFIGLGSGLSWLAWSLGKPVVLISGFSDPISEFPTPYRVHSKNVCNSCWNDPALKFDPSKWDWCPRNKDFECSSKITFEMVKEKIDECISNI